MHCTVELKDADSVRGDFPECLLSATWIVKWMTLGDTSGFIKPKTTEMQLLLLLLLLLLLFDHVGGRAVTGNANAVKTWLFVLVTHILAL